MYDFKQKYIEGLIEGLAQQFLSASQAAKNAQSEANSHKGAMESRYDTFKEEAQYLSNAHRLRANSLELAIAETKEIFHYIDKIPTDFVSVGSLVMILTQNDEKRYYFIIPYGSGDILSLNSIPVFIIGKNSPIAEALVGARIGEEVEIILPTGVQTYEVLAIR